MNSEFSETEIETFSRHVEQLQAFQSLGGLILGYLVAAGLADQDDLRKRLVCLATVAGEDLAKETGQDARPNPMLMEMATTLELIGAASRVAQGNRPN